jgi:hypothetical protein
MPEDNACKSSTERVASLLPRADRFCDQRTDDPYWNESVWFSISKPEERLHGLIQYYFRPNMGMLNGGPMLWGSERHLAVELPLLQLGTPAGEPRRCR